VRLAVAQLRRLPPNMQGALWLVSGGFIFTSNSAMIRLLSTEIESVQTAFFRAFFSVLLLAPMMLTGRVKPWQSERIQGHFWRTAMGTTSMVLGFYAVSMLPLADATAIAFSQPLFSVVVAAVIAGEKVRWRRWSATIVGFAGVLVMVRPGAESLQPGALIALANAATVALSILLVKRLSDSETPLMILTQFALFSTLLLAPPAIWMDARDHMQTESLGLMGAGWRAETAQMLDEGRFLDGLAHDIIESRASSLGNTMRPGDARVSLERQLVTNAI